MPRHEGLLPELVHDFRHARVEDVTIGPKREVSLAVTPLIWEGHNARDAEMVTVRFGAILNFAEVSAFLKTGPHLHSELAWLRYADGTVSKPGSLYIELGFERIDARMVIQCSSLRVRTAAS
ncbi:MAG: hypothetical protein EHM18_00815 [Acidobacteria bacterium]|nr:MAG: hypothetical protein EHM18_00815 [Acidobacteriota bacterium]